MKKNGFTLVELLAVIVILGIIITLSVPKVMQLTNNKKQTLYEDNISELERLASTYIIDYPEVLRENPISIPVSALCNGGYIECPIIDPRDNSEIAGNVLVNEVNGKYFYSYNTDTLATVELTIDTNGGEIFENQTGSYQQRQLIILNEPTKEGYIFVGWYKISGNSILSVNNLIIGTEDTKIIAIWQGRFELTVSLDGGILSPPNPEGRYPSNAIIDLGMPTKENYDFAGWKKILGNSNVSVNSLVMGDEDTVVKALWTPTSYTIEYALNGGNASNPTTYNVESDSITLANPTKTGYTFDGWTGSNGTTKQTTVTIPSESTGNKSYTANWTPLTYTITYDCNGGQGSIDFTTFIYGNTTILNANECYKITAGSAGMIYYLKGWSKTSDATSVLFTDEQNITNSDQITSNTTLYAIWDTLFTITGNYEVINDNSGNWRVKIKGAVGQTYGSASILFNTDTNIDIFLVGGGGGGSSYEPNNYGSVGGAGGYTKTATVVATDNTNYLVVVGNGGGQASNGGNTSAFNFTASGGQGVSYTGSANGGSGGGVPRVAGGSNGGNAGGKGQISLPGPNGETGNTKEFGEETGELYSGGGGGACYQSNGAGGSGGGGTTNGGIGATNKGGGGGGGGWDGTYTGGAGGSGIVVIRNAR